jgi:hypothetical protein
MLLREAAVSTVTQLEAEAVELRDRPDLRTGPEYADTLVRLDIARRVEAMARTQDLDAHLLNEMEI